MNRKKLNDKLIFEGKPFFNFPDHMEIEHVKKSDFDKPATGNECEIPDPKQDIIISIFSAMNTNGFLLIVGRPSSKNEPDDLGKVAVIFNNHELTIDEFNNFEAEMYHSLPLAVFLRCWILSKDDFNEHSQITENHENNL